MTGADELDIKLLLQVALDERPHDDVAQRVMDRVAAMDTLIELFRLVGVAPIHWLLDAERIQVDGPDETGGRDDADTEHSASRDSD